MYRGRKVIMSWVTAGALTVASGVGAVVASQTLQSSSAAPSTAVTTPSTATGTNPTTAQPSVGLTTLRPPTGGDDGSYRTSGNSSSASNFDY